MLGDNVQDRGLPFRRVTIGHDRDLVEFGAGVRQDRGEALTIDLSAGIGGVGGNLGDVGGRRHGLMIRGGGLPVAALDFGRETERLNIFAGIGDLLDELIGRIDQIAKPLTVSRVHAVEIQVALMLLL